MNDDALETLRQRRSIRRYDHSRPLDDTLILRLLDIARMAPNTGNMQLYSAVITSEPSRLAEMATKGHFNQPAAAGAQAIVTFCIDMERFSRWCRLNEATPSLGNLQGLMWATMDTAIFAQQFVTAAELEGLGTCYLGTTTYQAAEIATLLGLPDKVVPLTAVAIGWPAEEGDEKLRLPLDDIVSIDHYEPISDLRLRTSYAPIEESGHAFVAENGKKSLAQVYTEVRYPADQTVLFSDSYRELLHRAGF
ncbi:MAG: nitroreductase family protein [Pseudoflavonifractor sp.]|nr:nitroreductase family protein [Alloprevotella sp.]MCM1117315.1 nitroreductase family protein [Pseudoflavonifractor sp.]